MQSVTLFVLVCLVGAVLSRPETEARVAGADLSPVASAQGTFDSQGAPAEHTRAKRGLLLLKKKLLLGALGLKAAKVAKVGAVAAGALALKSKGQKSVPTKVIVSDTHGGYGYSSHAPNYNVEVHSWSG